ncbi:MAG: aspartyl/glutamyl-tRNA amidotransferase subunit C [Treponema sp.]|jgi:aspartyl-tRNA(Asn)/glutamyl-tRNA(Gln) amidotransferase subunit C|nr:aspartyl/glutamyl-tRNA amidotransferase subunit C [Treponema sp.]
MQYWAMDLKELEETAQLAHLNVSREELAAALPAFEQMLGFFAAMQGADDDAAAFGSRAGALPRAGAGQAAGARLVGADHFRGDKDTVPGAGGAADLNEQMLNNAGERDGRFILIPNVL